MRIDRSRIVQALLGCLWAAAGPVAATAFGIWWDRADFRGEAPDLSGYGLLFVIALIGVLAVLWGAYRLAHHNHNEAAIITTAITAIAATIAVMIVGPEIGWRATWHLALIVVSAAAWLAGIFLLIALVRRNLTMQANATAVVHGTVVPATATAATAI